MRFPFGETVTVLRAPVGALDDYGNPVDDWAVATSTLIAGCALAPRYEAESGGADNPAVIVGFQLYAPPGSDIRATDRITVRGATFEVQGQPGEWSNPFTGVDFGVEVALSRVEGV